MARMLGRSFMWRRDTRWHKRIEQREAEREIAAFASWYETEEAAPWIDPAGWDAGLEAVLGECRHFCNGSHVISGHPAEACDFTCHPGLEFDPERAARFDGAYDEISRSQAR